MSVITTLRRGV